MSSRRGSFPTGYGNASNPCYPKSSGVVATQGASEYRPADRRSPGVVGVQQCRFRLAGGDGAEFPAEVDRVGNGGRNPTRLLDGGTVHSRRVRSRRERIASPSALGGGSGDDRDFAGGAAVRLLIGRGGLRQWVASGHDDLGVHLLQRARQVVREA